MEEGVTSLCVSTPLIGFGGSEVIPFGTIDLPVSMRTEPRRDNDDEISRGRYPFCV
ncbi:UNVERIFIED_CONTAM: hypothetical protein Sangu_1708000 [Sesamum angustifolium]|uniref:Uncharacterized protein n=1 Tax=Sesamum angustifolium TaxID=2727405 RepID=A0AAW2MJT6_9LAMI